MRIALTSDEPYPLHATVAEAVRARGHEVVPFGAIAGGPETPWPLAAETAARAIADGRCAEGIFFCWSGTGICMAANKLPGIRAALVWDAGGAAAARVWNHANVLCLSNRFTSDDLAREILGAWFDTAPGERGAAGVALLRELDARTRA